MHQIVMTRPDGQAVGKSLYTRVRVSNEGGVAAENVEVFVSEVRSVQGNDKQVVPTFLPMSLTWSHFAPPSSTVRIPAGLYRHCDLGRFQPIHDRVVFVMSVIVQPNPVAGGAIPHVLEAGTYEIDATITGDNVAPTETSWKLTFDGHWEEDETAMLQRVELVAA